MFFLHQIHCKSYSWLSFEQDGKFTYDLVLWRVRMMVFGMEAQQCLLSVLLWHM
jgi:hypothetical protein